MNHMFLFLIINMITLMSLNANPKIYLIKIADDSDENSTRINAEKNGIETINPSEISIETDNSSEIIAMEKKRRSGKVSKGAPAPFPYPQQSQQPKQPQKHPQPETPQQSQQPQKQPGGGGRGVDVLCGSHRAPTCAQCGNEPGSCNGDCKWEADKCQSKNAQGGNSGSPPPPAENPSPAPELPATTQPAPEPNNSGGCEWSEWTACKDERKTSICGRRSRWQSCGSPPPPPSENPSPAPEPPATTQPAPEPTNSGDGGGGGGDVLCGSHRAATCDQCGNEAGKCNADCKWEANTCQSKNSQALRSPTIGSPSPPSENPSPAPEPPATKQPVLEPTNSGGSPPPPTENPSPASEPPATIEPAPEPTNSGGFSDYEQQSLIAHNKFRKMEGAGLSDLVLDQSICQLVKAYANKLGRMQAMEHDYSAGMTENLHMAGAKLTPQEVAQSWYDEKTQPGCTDFACNGHYKNMVDPSLKKMCMAADNGGKKNWLVVARYAS